MKDSELVQRFIPCGEVGGETAGVVVAVENNIIGDFRFGKEAYSLQHGRPPTVVYLGRQTRMRLFGASAALHYIGCFGGPATRAEFDGLVVYVVDAVEYMAFGG